jgi:tyrosine-protein kinase Etk/Wzc
MTSDQQYSLKELLEQLSKWRKQIFYTTLIVAVLSVLGTLLLDDYYNAETVFYAASQDMADPVPLGLYEKNIRIYGDDKDLDRLFSIASSNEVLFFLIDSFDMYDRYDIKKEEAKSRYKVKTKFTDHYKTVKTKHGAIQLSFEDKDPGIAAGVANAARQKINETAQKIIKESQHMMASKFESNIASKESLLDSISAKVLQYKKSSRIYDSRTQGEIYTTILAGAASELEENKAKYNYYKGAQPYKQDSVMKYQAMVQGLTNKLNQITAEMNSFEEGISMIRKLETEEFRLYDQLSSDKERLKQLNATLYSPFTALHVVELAEVPVKASRPKRAILVMISVMVAFVLSCLGVFVIENLREFLPAKN